MKPVFGIKICVRKYLKESGIRIGIGTGMESEMKYCIMTGK